MGTPVALPCAGWLGALALHLGIIACAESDHARLVSVGSCRRCSLVHLQGTEKQRWRSRGGDRDAGVGTEMQGGKEKHGWGGEARVGKVRHRAAPVPVGCWPVRCPCKSRAPQKERGPSSHFSRPWDHPDVVSQRYSVSGKVKQVIVLGLSPQMSTSASNSDTRSESHCFPCKGACVFVTLAGVVRLRGGGGGATVARCVLLPLPHLAPQIPHTLCKVAAPFPADCSFPSSSDD